MQKIETTFIEVVELVPEILRDNRGYFLESFSTSFLPKFKVEQMNVSFSQRGTIRGIHYAKNPPGQEKFVHCIEGEILDVVVDLRADSSTFGTWTSVKLSSTIENALYIPNGFGHAFQALSETAKVMYLCSERYNPSNEFGINPLDVDIAIDWPISDYIISERDKVAPSLSNYMPVE